MAEQEARHAVGGVGEAVLHVLGEVREVRHWPAARRFVSMLLGVRSFLGKEVRWRSNRLGVQW